MIKIRRPTKKGDQAMSLELIEGRSEIDQEFRKGNFAAVNRNDDRIVIQTIEEIRDGDEVLVFPRISGETVIYC